MQARKLEHTRAHTQQFEDNQDLDKLLEETYRRCAQTHAFRSTPKQTSEPCSLAAHTYTQRYW